MKDRQEDAVLPSRATATAATAGSGPSGPGAPSAGLPGPANSAAGQPDLNAARQVAVDAAEAAGELLRFPARRDIKIRVKDMTGDVVSDLDLAAERLIIDRIRAAFPGHRIIAEESGLLESVSAPGTDTCTWLVDPLDGTNNMAISLPAYVVGIAFCVGNLPMLGVVHDPVAGQTWSAFRRGGARGPCGALAPPACRPAPHGPVLAWTQGHGVARQDAAAQALRLVLESTARRVLQLWAPLLSWVMLARGDIDGIVGYRAEAVDLPAGALIAMEAGIEIRRFDGRPFDDRIGLAAQDRSFVAGHPGNIGRLTRLVTMAGRIAPQVASLAAAADW
jgi:myo-inositol-1(or 4)-monophosphatase